MRDAGDPAAQFLAAAGWADAARHPLAGDASARRYERLRKPDGTGAILMDARADAELAAFVKIDRFLLKQGLSAPRILCDGSVDGFLLLEDLGEAIFARLLERDRAREQALYAAACDILIRLQTLPPPEGLPPYGTPEMAEAVAPALDWYRLAVTGQSDGTAELVAAMRAALDTLPPEAPVTILRDYHAENLLWLPDRDGLARVGLLDFQTAMLGHPVYDLASLLQDARRSVAPRVAEASIARFAAATDREPSDVARAVAVLGAQRHLRILGIFTRLAKLRGKPGYLDLLPRVWGDLTADLAHPACAPLRAAVRDLLPAPTPDTLMRIKTDA
ncbi:MAG: phosphotransferase [Paracoccaceae bacterium]|nr:phosphotransferase [Paracoccaceae bacterium]